MWAVGTAIPELAEEEMQVVDVSASTPSVRLGHELRRRFV